MNVGLRVPAQRTFPSPDTSRTAQSESVPPQDRTFSLVGRGPLGGMVGRPHSDRRMNLDHAEASVLGEHLAELRGELGWVVVSGPFVGCEATVVAWEDRWLDAK